MTLHPNEPYAFSPFGDDLLHVEFACVRTVSSGELTCCLLAPALRLNRVLAALEAGVLLPAGLCSGGHAPSAWKVSPSAWLLRAPDLLQSFLTALLWERSQHLSCR